MKTSEERSGRVIETPAIVLRFDNSGETDRIVTLFTEEAGKVSAIAKSSRRSFRRFGAALDLFTIIEARFARMRGPSRPLLEKVRAIELLPEIRKNLGKFGQGCRILELLAELFHEGETAPATFRLAVSALKKIATGEMKGEGMRSFEIRVAATAGFKPDFTHACSQCGSSGDALSEPLFSLSRGAFICGRCLSVDDRCVRVRAGTLKSLAALSAGNGSLSRRVAMGMTASREAEELLAGFLEYHLGRKLRARAVALELERYCPLGG